MNPSCLGHSYSFWILLGLGGIHDVQLYMKQGSQNYFRPSVLELWGLFLAFCNGVIPELRKSWILDMSFVAYDHFQDLGGQ